MSKGAHTHNMREQRGGKRWLSETVALTRRSRSVLTFRGEGNNAPEAFHRAADSCGGGGVGVDRVRNRGGGTVEQLVVRHGRECQ